MKSNVISSGAILFFIVFLAFFSECSFAGSSNTPSGEGGSCGKPDLETERRIIAALKSLSVMVPDSSNCGGPGADGCFTSQATMPDFCGSYEVCVTVAGSVETMNSGYDEVALNGILLFGSEGRGIECGMKSAVGSTTIVVEGGDTVSLSCTTNDGLHHVGAHARVTEAKIVRRPCLSGGGAPGNGGCVVGCASFSASLGRTASGRSAGLLSFEYGSPDAAMFTRAGLSLAWPESDASVSVLAEAGGVPVVWSAPALGWRLAADGSEYTGTATPVIRRVAAPECVADLADVAGGYEIRYYLPQQLQGGSLSGEPYLVWRIRNVSAAPGGVDRMEVTETRNGSAVSVSVLEHDASTGDWSRVSGTGADAVRETVGERAENGDILRFRKIQDASGNTVSYRANLCREFPWGEEVVEERDGLAAPRVTVHSFYDDAANDGDCYGRLRQTVSYDGSWTRYAYDAEGRVVREVTPWLDTPPGSADALCRVVEHTYSETFPQTTTVTRIAGAEVSRTYSGTAAGGGFADSHSIRAASPGAAWDAAGNMRSFTRALDDQSSPFHGTALVTVNADGTGLLRTVEPADGGLYAVSVQEGRLADPWSDSRRVVSGTRTASVCGADGRILTSEVTDVESGIRLWTVTYSYDPFGRRTGAEYGDGTSELTEHGCCGPVRTVTRDGSETLMGHDAEGRLSFRTADGVTTFLTYDAAGRTVAETVRGADGRTLTTRHEYDEHGDLVATVTPAGRRTAHSRGMAGGRWTETTVHPDGGTEVTSHSLDGSVVSVSGTAAVAVRYAYSVVGNRRVTRTIWRDPQGGEGEWEETTLDFLGRAVRVSYPDGTSSTTEYDGAGRAVRATSPAGRVTLRAYGHPQFGDVTAADMDGDGEIDFGGPDLVQASRSLCALLRGRPVRRAETWRFEDEDGTPTLVSRTDTAVDGLLEESTSGGVTTRDEVLFRGASRVLRRVTRADGSAVEQEWLAGRLRRTVSALDGTAEYFTDGFGRQSRAVTVRNGVRQSSQTAYDADGNVVSETVSAGGEGRTFRRTPDAAGRVVREERADGTVVLCEYDLRGNLTLEHGDTYRVAYAYDHRNRRVSMTTWRTSDGSGSGDTTRWAYDARGRMVRKTYADGTHVDYAYDADGKLVSRTSARGVVRTCAYDAAGRCVSVSYSDGTPPIACAYDRAGRLVSVTDAAGTRALAYDANGNCVSEDVPQIPGRVVTRTFDALSRRTGLALGTDISATYAYDGLGRVSSIASGVNTIALDYRTHGAGLAGKRWLRNDAVVAAVTAEHDAWGNVTGISFGAPGDLHSLGYLYDLADRRTQASLPDGTKWLYGYDRLSQVVSGERVVASTGAPVDGGSFRYAYDGLGNRISSRDGSASSTRRYTSNPLNQYTGIAATGVIPIRGRADADAAVAVTATIGGQATTHRPARDGQAFSVDIPVDSSAGAVTAHVSVDAVKRDGTLDVDLHRRLSGNYTVPAATPEAPTYDADGNLLTYDGWTYAWNGEDRLASATRGTVRLEFRYDYLGRRFEKRVYEDNTLTKHQLFVYDGFKQIAEYDALSGNALANTYVWQPVGLDVPLLRNGSEFYVADANKNVVALIDASGTVTDTYVYDPFGSCTHSGDSDNPFRFSSEYFDGETGQVYYNYRYYSPLLGRWLSRDPKADGIIFKNSLLSFLLSGSVDNMDVLLLLSEENEIDINRFIYTFSKNCPTIIIDYLGLDTRGWDWISCMATCIEDNDPIKLAIAKALLLIGGASIPKETVALLAESVGDIELARKIRMSLKIPGISRYTTIPSALSAKLRMGGRSSLRAFGRFANQVLIGYGLALSAVEAHCTGHCCGLRHYDQNIGNIMNQLEIFFE